MRIVIFVLAGLLLISLVSAQQVLITPNPLDISVEVGETYEGQLVMTNEFDFSVFDFEFSNLSGFTFPDIRLDPNETKTIDFSVSRSEAGVSSIDSVVSFKYLVDIPEGKRTHTVNITKEGPFDPDYLIIRKGDTVKWNNNDDITRSVTSPVFDQDVEPNGTFSYTFNQLGEVPYQDIVLYYGAHISVLNETEAEKVNNPSYNEVLKVNLEVTLDPTVIEMIASELEHTIPATGSKESSLSIKNKGEILAQNVILSSEPSWIQFDENNFNLQIGETNIVTYTINPLVLSTEETNKTYQIKLMAKGSNTDQISAIMNVFIPYNDNFDDLETNEGFLAFYLRYCQQNPNLLICNNTVSEGGGTTTVIDPVLQGNITFRELQEALRRIRGIQDQVTRTTNEQKQLNNLIQQEFPQFMELVNQSVQLQRENEAVSTARTRSFWILLFFTVLIVCIVLASHYIRKYLNKKSTLDQGYRPSYYYG